MKALIFYMALIAMVAWGIAQVKASLPIVKQELGIIENRYQAIESLINQATNHK